MSEEEIDKLCALCRIGCSTEERIALKEALSKVLQYMEQISTIDTSFAPPYHGVLGNLSSVLRSDEPGPLLSREVFLANAPAHTGGMIRVPSIMKSELQ